MYFGIISSDFMSLNTSIQVLQKKQQNGRSHSAQKALVPVGALVVPNNTVVQMIQTA